MMNEIEEEIRVAWRTWACSQWINFLSDDLGLGYYAIEFLSCSDSDELWELFSLNGYAESTIHGVEFDLEGAYVTRNILADFIRSLRGPRYA